MSRQVLDYTGVLDRIGLAAAVIADEPLADMLAAVNHYQTVGLIMEPTAYVRGGGRNLADQERLIRAAIKLADVVNAIRTDGGQP